VNYIPEHKIPNLHMGAPPIPTIQSNRSFETEAACGPVRMARVKVSEELDTRELCDVAVHIGREARHHRDALATVRLVENLEGLAELAP
jgi:hypothetical protein